jgi:hypothetical protein
MSWQRTLDDHLFGPGPKRILSLDGGGVRGLITLGMLKKVETVLQARHGREIRLCDYFDLIGGTSTGALIAALLALGYRVDEVIALYKEMIPNIFYRTNFLQGISSKFDSSAFSTAIDKVIGDFLERSGRDRNDIASLRMNSPLLQTGLAIAAKRIDTGSVWVLTNNRQAKYWDANSKLWRAHLVEQKSTEFFPNSDYELRTIVRASASAPFYLDGVELKISKDEIGHFLDGAVSPFNNPGQELFLMTALRAEGPGWNDEQISPYGFNWRTGADNLMMLSLGCGAWRHRIASNEFARKYAIQKAFIALTGIIDDTSTHSIVWMQAISKCPRPYHVNSNLLGMRDLRVVDQPLLTYLRINARLEHDWLEAVLGPEFKYTDNVLARTRELDRSDRRNLDRLLSIGLATGKKMVSPDDFPPAFDLQRKVMAA